MAFIKVMKAFAAFVALHFMLPTALVTIFIEKTFSSAAFFAMKPAAAAIFETLVVMAALAFGVVPSAMLFAKEKVFRATLETFNKDCLRVPTGSDLGVLLPELTGPLKPERVLRVPVLSGAGGRRLGCGCG